MVRIREKAGCKDEMIRDDGRIYEKEMMEDGVGL